MVFRKYAGKVAQTAVSGGSGKDRLAVARRQALRISHAGEWIVTVLPSQELPCLGPERRHDLGGGAYTCNACYTRSGIETAG